MARIQQISLHAMIPRPKLELIPHLLLPPMPLPLLLPLQPILLSDVRPHHIVEIAVRLCAAGDCRGWRSRDLDVFRLLIDGLQ